MKFENLSEGDILKYVIFTLLGIMVITAVVVILLKYPEIGLMQ
jgi:hypothetical protein